MLSFTGCTYGLTGAESEELRIMRENTNHWKVKKINSTEQRIGGLCPLTPKEVGIFLQALGYPPSTLIYIAAGEIYGGNTHLSELMSHFPNLVFKETLATKEELKAFARHASQTAALDYIISVESDVFVPSYSGNMARAVEGHRRFLGHRKTITPDRKGLVKLFDKLEIGKLREGSSLSSLVQKMHKSWQGAPRKRRVALPGLKGIPEKTVVWTANRDDSPVSGNATLLFTATDGRLVLQTPQGQETSITDIPQSAYYVSMLDTGNFVLCNSDGDIIWQTFAHPTDTLLPTQRLTAGKQLISSASKTDQSTDGNLVQYPNDDITVPTAYWASGTYGMGDKMSLNLDENGNIYLLNATGFNVKNITSGVYATPGAIYLLRIDWDGLFRLYSHNLSPSSRWSVPWNSTTDRCDARGLCGLNSFCVSNDLEPGCSCLPGFAPVIQGNWTSGCERNFTAESCKNKGRNYIIRAEDNTIWQDVSYSVQSQTSKEDCKQACLVDCNCEAALYKDGQCKKQRLPLKYGRRSSQSGSIAFVKVEDTSESFIDMLLPTREGKKGILTKIIICLFVSLLVVNVVILGVIHHRYRASSFRRISYNGNIGICGDIAPRSFSYAELEVMTDGIPEKTVVWTANRDDSPVSGKATLLFTATDGRLVLQTPQGQETSIADIPQFASYVSMLDTGNFVLCNSDGDIIWQTFAHPTDTLLPTQRLTAGKQLISSASKTDQSTDGNLVQYPNDAITVPTAYWASGTDGMGGKTSLNLDENGNICLLNATGFNVDNITSGVYATPGVIYLLRIDWDGLFRLYSHNLSPSSRWSVPWNSTTDRCAARGLCGLNSFCVSNDLEPGCSCLPGFAPVIQGNWTSGCERNFTAESCKNKGRNYIIRAEDNTIWQDVSYSVQSQTSKEDCRQACLVDCNCEVALYKDGSCKKQRLPLRYERRSLQSGSTAFIKVEDTSESFLPTREGKREIIKDIIIIIISCLFVSSLVVIVVILVVVNHRHHVSSYRRTCHNGDIEFCEDIAPRQEHKFKHKRQEASRTKRNENILCQYTVGNVDAPSAELLAIQKACPFCASKESLGGRSICIESDSEVAVFWVNDTNFGNLSMVNVIYDICSTMHILGNMTIRFVPRSANSIADGLAKKGLALNGEKIVWREF
ncbi:hypothetical protein LWI28_011145 [Acer negundo]|uniref:O-fucosyltransferase family protein n=1 Tax=Acer negundo TaxID=4023 RepID=A0AAD5IJ17_ACENE|nr:hypothetical protein LWI28_011145 [Acer negundo]